MIRVIGPKDRKNYPSYINTTSSSPEHWSKLLSPFYLGPVNLYSNYKAKNIENAWQFSKVYKHHIDPDGWPTNEYFKWAKQGWDDEYAHRYPMGKGAIPEYSYWEHERMGYIEARKRIYIPLYSEAVLNTDSFKQLKEMYENGQDIILFDYDGYSDYLNLEQVVNNPLRKMGHAFVLAMLLEGSLV